MNNLRPLDLSAFGLETDLAEDTNIMDVVVLMRVVNPDCGHDGVYIASTPGMSWLTKLGLVTASEAILKSGIYREGEDDE